jgi:hypothetical protein
VVGPNYIKVLVALTAIVGLIIAGLSLTAKPAHAATFTVNSTDGDSSDIQIRGGNPGDGICDVDSNQAGSQCTIRAAIEEANASASVPDVISFDIPDDPNVPGNEVRTINVGKQGAANLPPVTDQVTIDGYSQGKSTTSTTADDATPNTLKQGTNAKLLVELNGQFTGGGPGLSIEASNSVVKGLIINRSGWGIEINGSNNKVEGNFIGTDASGTGDQGNANYGLELGFPSGGSNNVVGGTSPAARNLISGNNGPGISITRDASGNRIEGNLIGTQKDGTSPLGNSGAGVEFFGGSQNTIGGTTPATANTIAHNTGDGMSFFTLFTANPFVPSRDRILGNSVFANDGLGIDLTNDGRTNNDTTPPPPPPPPDSDTGENELQNFPGLTSAKPAMKKGKKVTTIKGTLVSTPNRTFTIQLFSNPPGEDEGKTFIGQVTGVKTDSNGNASFSKSVTRKRAPVGSAITATATDSNGNTSELADPKTVA